MSQFRFAELSWLHAVWFVGGLAILLVMLELRGRSILDRLVSPTMQARLVSQSSLARRITAIGLMTLSLAALVLALMRPQWGMTVQRLARINSQIMVCLDVSKSMLAEDVAPNRLDRAKVELESLLALMDEGQQVGLIAFAGKATVLCPMTTDFGFLRLVLADATPYSVGLGGTRIGEALRKAVEGFGAAGDVNRLILLITDGEDHDSFPLDAAKAARERGIRVISIGFGDEAGSKIEITDPRTGVRSFVTDSAGNEVISRLDGTTLREIALETEGAYIPAGTGALDLESIYETHIASLLRGTTADQERIVRHEAYQWCVVASLVFLLFSLLSASPWSLASGRVAREATPRGWTRAAGWVGLLGLLAGPPLLAQGPTATGGASTRAARIAEEGAGEADEPSRGDGLGSREQVSPREAYNSALAFLGRDPERAQRLLNQARREAGVDGEVRFRALYNLGWVEVNRADALLEEQPREALGHLEQAAHRFREAIRVRPESLDARHNLEIISRRILELSDALARQDPRNVESRLEELIQAQRATQAELASLVQRVAADGGGHEKHRLAFRRAGITQRQILSDMQKLASDARRELEAWEQKTDEERSNQESLRPVQLNNMLRYVEISLQRMQKARGLTRRMQGSRAFHRWSAALNSAKRARDQLRDPVEILDVITEDASRLAEWTRTLAADRSSLVDDENAVTAPAWLTKDLLRETQGSTTDRTVELAEMLQAVTRMDRPEDAAAAAHADQDGAARRLMANIHQALPLIRQAAEFFREANAELETERFDSGYEKQRTAIATLRVASELFFDIRRLIELIYGQQQLMREALQTASERSEVAQAMVAAVTEALPKNLWRCERLDSMFDSELARIADSTAQAAQGPPPPQASTDPELQRYRNAKQILQGAVQDLDRLGPLLGQMATASPQVDSPPAATTEDEETSKPEPETFPDAAGGSESERSPGHVDLNDGSVAPGTGDPLISDGLSTLDASLNKMEELRRLFFTLLEHLRDTAQRQGHLNDDTHEVAGKSEWQTSERIGPLAHRQQGLQEVAAQLSQALHEQAEQAGPRSGQAPPPDASDPAAAAAPLRQAGDLVGEASSAMEQASVGLNEASADEAADGFDMDRIGGHQQTALQKLSEALALLEDARNQDQPQGDRKQEPQPRQASGDQPRQNDGQNQQQNVDAHQLLQLIRDREAQRRRDRHRAARASSSTVEKDW